MAWGGGGAFLGGRGGGRGSGELRPRLGAGLLASPVEQRLSRPKPGSGLVFIEGAAKTGRLTVLRRKGWSG